MRAPQAAQTTALLNLTTLQRLLDELREKQHLELRRRGIRFRRRPVRDSIEEPVHVSDGRSIHERVDDDRHCAGARRLVQHLREEKRARRGG